MNVEEIVKQYLEQNGFDGLYKEDFRGEVKCCCEASDPFSSCSSFYFPCSEYFMDCEPGYKTSQSQDDFEIRGTKNGD